MRGHNIAGQIQPLTPQKQKAVKREIAPSSLGSSFNCNTQTRTDPIPHTQQAGLLAHGSSYLFRPSHMANYHAVALIKTFVPTYSDGTAVELHDFPFFISKFGYGKPTENLMIIDYHISKICIQGKTCNLIRDYHSKLS
jgi:hypothetical protein